MTPGTHWTITATPYADLVEGSRSSDADRFLTRVGNLVLHLDADDPTELLGFYIESASEPDDVEVMRLVLGVELTESVVTFIQQRYLPLLGQLPSLRGLSGVELEVALSSQPDPLEVPFVAAPDSVRAARLFVLEENARLREEAIEATPMTAPGGSLVDLFRHRVASLWQVDREYALAAESGEKSVRAEFRWAQGDDSDWAKVIERAGEVLLEVHSDEFASRRMTFLFQLRESTADGLQFAPEHAFDRETRVLTVEIPRLTPTGASRSHSMVVGWLVPGEDLQSGTWLEDLRVIVGFPEEEPR